MRPTRRVVMNVLGAVALVVVAVGLYVESPWVYVPGLAVLSLSPFRWNFTSDPDNRAE